MSEDIQIWKERIQAAEKSILSIKAWCEQAGVRKNKYFYWKKKISELDNTDDVHIGACQCTQPRVIHIVGRKRLPDKS